MKKNKFLRDPLYRYYNKRLSLHGRSTKLNSANDAMPSTLPKLITDLSINQATYFDLFIMLALKSIDSLGLQMSEINFTIFLGKKADFEQKLPTLNVATDIPTLMEMGMSFFPALVLCTTNATKRPKISISYIGDGSVERTMDNVVIAMFLQVFYVMTVANLPTTNEYIPKIILDTFGPGIKPADVFKDVYNCTIQKLDSSWVKDFPFGQLPAKFKNRLGLSIAGYRILQAFSKMKTKAGTPADVLELQKTVDAILAAGPDFNVHPGFRSTTIVTKYGSINKSLTGLMALHGDKDWLSTAARNKLIFSVPEALPVDQRIFKLDVNDFNQNKIDLETKVTEDLTNRQKQLDK